TNNSLQQPATFEQCNDPVLRLALQQCFMEAMISAAQRAQQGVRSVRIEEQEEQNDLDPVSVRKEPGESAADGFSWAAQLVDSLSISNDLENKASTSADVEVGELALPLSMRECLVCCELERNVLLSPCGHVVACEKCAVLLKKCLHCRKPIESAEKVPSCRECASRPAQVLTRPCAHFLVCGICLKAKFRRVGLAGELDNLTEPKDEENSKDHALKKQKLVHQLLLNGELCGNRTCPQCSAPVECLWTVETASLGLSQELLDRQHVEMERLPPPSAPYAPPLDKELRKLQHELQVMREQTRCPICLDRSRNLVFMCGHATCQWCGDQVTHCPICRRAVSDRIVLY
ncbi:hypothetical protein Ciccas_007860, partial [Cichlidogyrus casuarinus]